MIKIGITNEHISTLDYFKQFPKDHFGFVSYPKPIHIRKNFAKFPRRFLKRNNISLVHVKNFTITNRIKWIAEHEHSYNMLPLTPKRLKLMSSEYCRKITFYSNYAKKTALFFLDKVDPFIKDKIMNKSEIIYPATYTKPIEHTYKKEGCLNICFIGNEFIRKGGLNSWEVFTELEKDYDIKLTLITNFHNIPRHRTRTLPGYPNYCVFQKRLDNLLSKKSSKVTIIKNSNRTEVINRYLPQADIFLAPTFADSFGIANIEAMSQGLPIIASNINALPEMIENEKEGLLIDNSMQLFPLIDNSLHMKYSWQLLKTSPFQYFTHVNMQLKEKLIRLIEQPELRSTLGKNAKIKFNNKFSFAKRNKKFNEVYLEAIR